MLIHVLMRRMNHLERDHLEPDAFKATHNFTDQPALDAIWFEEDECSFESWHMNWPDNIMMRCRWQP